MKSKNEPEEEIDVAPSSEDIVSYWSSLWSANKEYNVGANWLKVFEIENQDVSPMKEPEITCELLAEVIKSRHSWKGPGSDKIHNFWYKKLTSVHHELVEVLNDLFEHPEKIPPFITEGRTYLLAKGKKSTDPSKYRPITCLQTVYKIMTSCVAKMISKHLDSQNLMSDQQKGCRRGTKGCKEQLIIDLNILNEVKKKKRKLYCCYIDYQKAYDSVSHS